MQDSKSNNGAPGRESRFAPRRAARLAAMVCTVAVAMGAGVTHAHAESQNPGAQPDVIGRWMTKDHDGVFEINRCGQELCGRLAGLRYTTEMPRDKRGEPECNLPMLNGFTPDSDSPGHWNGRVTDPDTGHVYHAKLWVSQNGDLKLRGFVGVPLFGETETWSRYTGTIGPACKLP
ncbi:hypothetical protein JCM25156A_00840 [Komagataeibacter kakiaceti JCM 25156]|uniref:DUF2147 domain-containing protein n=1 Tax=Komagataeibacter kakiaceti TaxID=943261 RepID=UPI000472DA58